MPPGFPRFDPQASNGFAVSVSPSDQGVITRIPLIRELGRGRHRFLFRMKIEGTPPEAAGRIGRLDALARGQNRVLGVKNLMPGDFAAGDTWLDIELEAVLLRAQAVDLRIYSDGRANLRVDSVRILEPFPPEQNP